MLCSHSVNVTVWWIVCDMYFPLWMQQFIRSINLHVCGRHCVSTANILAVFVTVIYLHWPYIAYLASTCIAVLFNYTSVLSFNLIFLLLDFSISLLLDTLQRCFSRICVLDLWSWFRESWDFGMGSWNFGKGFILLDNWYFGGYVTFLFLLLQRPHGRVFLVSFCRTHWVLLAYQNFNDLQMTLGARGGIWNILLTYIIIGIVGLWVVQLCSCSWC